MLLLSSVLADAGTRCCIDTALDFKKIESRIEHEGLSFLTISLPIYGKDFQKSLDQGFVSHDQFKGFAFGGGLPRLFSGFLVNVFDSSTGVLLDKVCIDCISSIRQISLMFQKIKIPCSESRMEAAKDAFIKCEKDVREHDVLRTELMMNEFAVVRNVLWADLFSKSDKQIYDGDIKPNHGKGATADSLKGNSKWKQRTWTRRLEEEFPFMDYLFSSFTFAREDEASVNILEPGQELAVKVTLVPKTLSTPRVIAIEPTCMQYMQQAVRHVIEDNIAGDDFLNNIMGSSSQKPNRRLAQMGSVDGSFATIDLSEASDRVSNQLVRHLFANHPHLNNAVDATRSRKADIQGRPVIRLAKFASMGSALCFPVQSMVFTTIIFAAIAKELNTPVTLKLIKSFKGRVRVYGDDIIVPVRFASRVVEYLHAFGLKVNTNKSFWTGKFRESCGGDYYEGTDVTPVRVRRMIPTRRDHVQEIVSTVSLRNQLYKAGYWRSVRYLDSVIERLIPFPAVLEGSPGLGKTSFLGYESTREHPTLHHPLVRAMCEVARPPVSKLSGGDALMKFFLKSGLDPIFDKEHLERAGRPITVRIKNRWIRPF